MHKEGINVTRPSDASTQPTLSDTDAPSAVAATETLESSSSPEENEQVRESPSDHDERATSHVVHPLSEDVRHTRISGAWAAIVVAVVLGVALVDFIVENTHSVRVNFFSVSGYIPVAVALLAASLAGAFVVVAVGVSRTTQLRLALRRRARREKAHALRSIAENDPSLDSKRKV